MTAVVETYLRRTGGATLADLCRDLKLTPKDAKVCFRKLGAEKRTFCDAWQLAPTVVERSLVHRGLGRRTAMRRLKPFTIWRMPRSES